MWPTYLFHGALPGRWKRWMMSNWLKVNDSKTEIIVHNTNKIYCHPIDDINVRIGEEAIAPKPIETTLAISPLMEHQVIATINYYSLQLIANVKYYLTWGALAQVINAKLNSHIESHIGVSQTRYYIGSRLPRTTWQRLVTYTNNFPYISPVLQDLHWLPTCHRVPLKLFTDCLHATECYWRSSLIAYMPQSAIEDLVFHPESFKLSHSPRLHQSGALSLTATPYTQIICKPVEAKIFAS